MEEEEWGNDASRIRDCKESINLFVIFFCIPP